MEHPEQPTRQPLENTRNEFLDLVGDTWASIEAIQRTLYRYQEPSDERDQMKARLSRTWHEFFELVSEFRDAIAAQPDGPISTQQLDELLSHHQSNPVSDDLAIERAGEAYRACIST